MHVLIVDDEAIVGRVISRALLARNFSTLVCTTAEEALKAVETETYALAFLDVKLADWDGFELFEQLKQHEPAMKIVLMTGYLNPALEERARRIEAFDFLQKPFHIQQVRAIAERAREAL